MTLIAIDVGPAVVEESAGGEIVTSMTSCEPPNRVRLPGVMLVQLAVRPAGTIVYDSVSSPRLCTVSGSVSVSPGARERSSLENQAWTDTPSTLVRGRPANRAPSGANVRLGGVPSPEIVTPSVRPRRLRRTPAMRELVAQHHVRVTDLVAPLFVREGVDQPQPIASLPGVVQHSRESLRAEVATLAGLGVRAW